MPRTESPRAAAAREGRARRGEAWEALFHPTWLATAGALASTAFLFQPYLPLKAFFFALFLAAALASGKRVSLLATLSVSLGIVAMNLAVPVGRVLFRWGPLVVTETALLEGIEKALTFEGLLYASKASIRSSLRIPGRFGALIGSAFVYYDRIVEYRGRVRPGSFMADADALMLEVWEGGGAGPAAPEARRGRPLGLALLASFVLLAFGALGLGLLQN